METPDLGGSSILSREAFSLPDRAPAATARASNGAPVQEGRLIAANWTSSESTVQSVDPSTTPVEWPTPVWISQIHTIAIPVHGQPTILQVRAFKGPLDAAGAPKGSLGVTDCALVSSTTVRDTTCTYTMSDAEIVLAPKLHADTRYFVVFGQWYLSVKYNKNKLQANNLASWAFAVRE